MVASEDEEPRKDLPTMEFTFNEVLRLPGCSACGGLFEREDKELHFDLRALIKS